MRIGVLTTSYPRSPADHAGRFVAELSSWLAEHGDHIEVLAPQAATDHRARQPNVVRIRYARKPRLFYRAGAPDNLLADSAIDRIRSAAQVPAFCTRTISELRRRVAAWDAILSHWILPSALLAAYAAPRVPHLAIAHGSDVALLARLPLARTLLRGLAGRCRLLLSSESLRPRLMALTTNRATRQWVATATVQRMGVFPPSDRGDDTTTLGRRSQCHAMQILFMGRLVPAKGVEYLLKACTGMPVRLLIVGDGPERQRLQAIATSRHLSARFVGFQHGADKERMLQQADVVVLPSIPLPDGRVDSAPVVLLEGMARGKPVVCTDVGGNRELVEDGVSGFVVAPADVIGLGRVLAKLAADRRHRLMIGENARRAASDHRWAKVGPIIRQELADLTDNRHCG